MEQLEKQARCCSEESDEGLGHSGSDGESNRTGSPTLNGTKIENPESMVEVDADGKRKEDLYKCRFCDRTFCYLCHLKVKFRTFFRSFFFDLFFRSFFSIFFFDLFFFDLFLQKFEIKFYYSKIAY